MRKRILSLLCVLALCLGLLPVTALAAAEGAPSQLYVGDQQVSSGNDITYWTTDTDGKLTASTGSGNWNVKYDPRTATLTLNGATILGQAFTGSAPFGAGIYALCSEDQPVALTIELIGTNTITGHYGIYVNANQTTPTGTDASLVIKNSGDNGSLTVTGTGDSGLLISSGSGDASLTINEVSVVASSRSSYSYAGVCVQSGATATGAPNISLSVDGGSLTASGTGSSGGIQFVVGNPSASATTSLTVTDQAIVDARYGGIKAYKELTLIGTDISATGSSGGIVFDGSTGTVYGSVTLQDNLEIKSGETLTVPDGSKLDCNNNLTNNGTINVESGGNLDGEPTSGTGTVVSAPKITTESLASGTVGAAYSQALQADNAPTLWSITSGSLPDGLNLSESTISGTPTTAGTSTFTVKAENSAGSDSKAFTLTVTQNSSYFEISTADQLRNFAEAVNTGNVTANAVLTADITLTGGNWTPIGKDNPYMYNGTFDGQGHTISGLQCSVTSGDVAGLFGVIGSSGVVKNVGIADSSVVATTGETVSAGGVCGWNQGTLENCWNSSSVSATANQANAGGVCGWNQGGTIRNCWNSGSVSARSIGSYDNSGAFAGGVCGMNYNDNDDRTAIQNCWNSGSVSASSSSITAHAGGVCGDNTGSINNCYWLDTACSTGVGLERSGTNPDVESKTTDEFASGEVAWLLNEPQAEKPWGQGSNGMPVLEDNHPASVTSYVPVRITIVMTDNTRKSYYSAKGSTFTEYPTGYAFVFKENGTQTWINKGTQTYDADATIYAVNMTLEKIPAKAPTCTEKGNIAYWYCAPFGKYFKDENGVNEITYESTVIPATGHELTKVAAKEPTSTQAGNIEYWVCSKCGKYFSDGNGENEITYESTVIPATGHSSGGGTPSKAPSQQAINKIEAAKDGSTVEINLSTGSTKLDKEVFEDLAGKDVTLKISVPGGVTWTVNGQDIPADADLTDLDLGVSMNTSTIPVSVINTITGAVDTIQLSLAHDGAFGFTVTLTVPLGKTNAGYWANLYYYNEETKALEFQAADRIASDGTASFPFSHASDYAIVIDDESHEPVELPFTDVPEDAWYADAAAYVYKHGLMAGTSATTFSPAMPLNRAMLMTMLARLAGVDTEGGATWYEKGLAWAVAAGVSDGTAPERDITRQELMTMLYRYVGSPTVSGDLSAYPDGGDVAAWAQDSMLWSVQTGLLQGDGAGKLNPAASATRMEVAVILMRFCGNVQD